MSPEEIGLAALIRPAVLILLLWIVYRLVRLGARYLPANSELRRICELTIHNANQRAEENRQRPE